MPVRFANWARCAGRRWADARHRGDRLWRAVLRLHLSGDDVAGGDARVRRLDASGLRGVRHRHDPGQSDRAALRRPGVDADGGGVAGLLGGGAGAVPFAAPHLPWLLVDVLAIGLGGALGTVLQTRLMDVAAMRRRWRRRSTTARSTPPMRSAPGRAGWRSPPAWAGPRPAGSGRGWRWAAWRSGPSRPRWRGRPGGPERAIDVWKYDKRLTPLRGQSRHGMSGT